MIKDLPIVYFEFDDNSELSIISGVYEPAIEQDFLWYSEYFELKMASDEERVITGPAMLAEKPLYRKVNGYEFYSCYSAETIKRASEYFLKNSINLKFDIEHQFDVNNVYGVESWVVDDPKNDKANALGFRDISKGDWYVSYKVECDDTWAKIKNGEIKGFSVVIKAKVDEIIEYNEYVKMTNILKSKLDKRSKLNELKKLFK